MFAGYPQATEHVATQPMDYDDVAYVELACPPTPVKPSLRNQLADKAVQQALELARCSLQELDSFDRAQALGHVPRHTVEPLFYAYCDWKANAIRSEFEAILEVVPDIEIQIHRQCSLALGNGTISRDAWEDLVHRAAYDINLKRHLSAAIAESLMSTTRKALFF